MMEASRWTEGRGKEYSRARRKLRESLRCCGGWSEESEEAAGKLYELAMRQLYDDVAAVMKQARSE